MKKVILLGLLAVFANADMCELYVKKTKESFDKYHKAKSNNLKSEMNYAYKNVVYYTEKMIINCEEGSKEYKVAVKMNDIFKNGVKEK